MKILVVQNRMGIGDAVIFLPFIEAISKKFGVPVTCLIKKSSKANEIFNNSKFINDFIFLERDQENKKHEGIIGTFKLILKLKKYNFDKIFIFNSSLRFYLISKILGIKHTFQYPLFKKNKQHIIYTARDFIKKTIHLDIESDPIINLDNKSVLLSKDKYNINNDCRNILLGIGGSGPTKRVPAKIIIETMQLINEKYKSRFFLATGKNEGEQKILNQILNSNLKDKCTTLDDLKINEILPIIKNCNLSICNDSSFSHLSSALGIKTIVMMTDTPLIYGNYSPRMYPIIPDGEKNVSHNTLGKDRINPIKILEKVNNILD